MKHARILLVISLATAIALPATSAYADPPSGGLEVILYCGPEVIPVAVAGNGAWTPAHDLNSTLVGVPLAFGPFTGVFTPTDGDPVEFTDPPFAKTNFPKTRNAIVECWYTVAGSFPDGTFNGAGSVTLMVPRIHLP